MAKVTAATQPAQRSRSRLAWLLGSVIAATGLLLVAILTAALALSYQRQPPLLSIAPEAVLLSTLEPDPGGEAVPVPAGDRAQGTGWPGATYVIVGSRLLAAAELDQRWLGLAVTRLAGYASGAAVTAMLLALSVGYMLAWRRSLPLEELARAASEASAGRLERRIAVPDGADEELRSLATSLNAMLDRLGQPVGDLEALNAYVSHELRNSLTSIRTQLEVGLAGAVGLPEAARGALVAAERTTGLVEDVLSLAAGSIPEPPGPVDLALVVAEVADGFCAQGRRLDLELPPDGLPPVLGHGTWLERAVHNLLDNAFKHGPAEGPVQVRLQERYGAVILTVRDYGPGIAPEHLDLVWKRFWRAGGAADRDPADRDPAARGRGYGLGLALVKQAAEAAGGGVWVTSQPGRGSEFCVSLPVALVGL